MKIPAAVSGFVLALIAICPIVRAYQRHLSAEAIQDAYNLGRKNDQDTAAFLARYFRQYATPQKGLYIFSVELLTPYAQLVKNAMLDMLNENIFDVQRKYASSATTILVRVRVSSTPTHTLPWPDNDIWKEIKIRVYQAKDLKFEKRSLNRVYPGKDAAVGFDYADMEFQFDARDVASRPITIEVSARDGQPVEASFDLFKLK